MTMTMTMTTIPAGAATAVTGADHVPGADRLTGLDRLVASYHDVLGGEPADVPAQPGGTRAMPVEGPLA